MKDLLYCCVIITILPLLAGAQGTLAVHAGRPLPAVMQLAGRADVVAIGTVAGMESAWEGNKTRIITRVSITVREFLKGSASGPSLAVYILGGEVGDVGEIYSGSPRFRRNEEVVVFAGKRSGGDHEVVGGDQGRVPIIEDRVSGVKTVLHGIPLDDFRAEIRSAAQAGQPGEEKP